MIVSRSEEMMSSRPPTSVLRALGEGDELFSEGDLPENVTWISSGCIISEAMAAIETWVSIPAGV